MEKAKTYTFWNGWNSVPVIKQSALKKDIMDALSITASISFNQRRQGKIEPRVSEKEKIEKIFKKYGVPATNVWGGSYVPIN